MANLINNLSDDAIREVGERLHSNKAINKAFQFLGNGAIDTINYAKRAIETESFAEAAKQTFKDEAGKWQYGRIAGAGIAAAGAVRIASGGGVYRDRNGNTDLIGIPLI